jgi:hypothetical protein
MSGSIEMRLRGVRPSWVNTSGESVIEDLEKETETETETYGGRNE